MATSFVRPPVFYSQFLVAVQSRFYFIFHWPASLATVSGNVAVPYLVPALNLHIESLALLFWVLGTRLASRANSGALQSVAHDTTEPCWVQSSYKMYMYFRATGNRNNTNGGSWYQVLVPYRPWRA